MICFPSGDTSTGVPSSTFSSGSIPSPMLITSVVGSTLVFGTSSLVYETTLSPSLGLANGAVSGQSAGLDAFRPCEVS